MAGNEDAIEAAAASDKISMKPCTAQCTKRKRVVSGGASELQSAADQPAAVKVIDGGEEVVVVALPAGNKLLDPAVEVIDGGGEEVVVLAGKLLLLSREVVDKILAIKRRPFSFGDDDIGSDDDELRELAVQHEALQDKFAACQAKIREHRHEGKGYAIILSTTSCRMAVTRALHPFVERYHWVEEEEDDDD
uniref:Uncharacterized protein n=1 Tax=Oryza glumipatula TaxID=40148 RepID=A0A0E0BL54_9ORYZ